MNFETIDWELEARRVGWAFGVAKPCAWKQELMVLLDEEATAEDETETSIHMGLQMAHSQYEKVVIGDDQFLACAYDSEGRNFQVYDSKVTKDSPFYDLVEIFIAWDGSHEVTVMTTPNRKNLARGLFHLDLLTPAIETSLKVSFTAHEKMEWKLEYEQKAGFRI